MLGVTKVESVVVLSVCSKVPPEELLYHLIVPGAELEAASVTVPGPHREPLMFTGAEGVG